METPSAGIARRTAARLLSPRGVVGVAVVLVAIQLGFRAWAIYGSWFQFDDFYFMARAMDPGFGLGTMFTSYGGHLMPAGYLATWLDVKAAPLDFTLVGSEMLAVLALADAGAIVFLVSAFGRRPGILPPLALYLFTVLSLPTTIWWAAAVNQLPFLAAVFWGGWTHLTYLRTRRTRWAVATAAITVVALAFQEKSLYGFVLYAFLALGYFATGRIGARIVTIYRTYRTGVWLYGVIAVGYVALYLWKGLAFNPAPGSQQPIGQDALNLGGYAYATGLLGGPVRWTPLSVVDSLANPGELGMLAAVALIAWVAYGIDRSRTRSRRVWILIGVVLGADIVLLTAGRSSIGPALALEYRYVTELAAISAIALGLATLPLAGAVETVEITKPSPFLDRSLRVTAAVVAISVLGSYSSYAYAHQWHSKKQSQRFFARAERQLAASPTRVPLADAAVPTFLLWGYSYPYNLASEVLRFYADRTSYPKIANDHLYTFADDGSIKPVVINAIRQSKPSADTDCPYPAFGGAVTIPLDGPVLGKGWWVRLGYYSPDRQPIHVSAGEDSYDFHAKQGLHSLFFEASGHGFSTLRISGLPEDSGFCVSDAQLGLPSAVFLPVKQGSGS